LILTIYCSYERELGEGQRSPFQYIEAQDAPASYPMVLCVSDILRKENKRMEMTDDQSQVELEVTDGWYRLRATIDPPLQRAIERKKLRVGMKIACFGARVCHGFLSLCVLRHPQLETNRKEPNGILDAYDSTSLTLTGNNTHLAPWHDRLGYRKHPFIASLRSLSPDGGLVPMIYINIVKVLLFPRNR
jgi:breast cancer 2 susceptibility protein